MAKLSLKNIWNKQTIFLLCVLLFALIYCCFRMSNASYFGKPLLEGNDENEIELTASDLDTKLKTAPTGREVSDTGVYLGQYQLRKTDDANLGGQLQGSGASNQETHLY